MLPRIEVSGSPFQIGLALGRAGRSAFMAGVLGGPDWRAVIDPRHALMIARIAGQVQARFPAIWAEVKGLAEGLSLPLTDVFAWQCRGEVFALEAADTPAEGCTTILSRHSLHHAEDGAPALAGGCFLAAITPEAAPGVLAFAYPGSLPGNGFAVTQAGLALAVDDLRFRGLALMMARCVLMRAVLGARRLADLRGLLTGAACAGYHLAALSVAEGRAAGFEFGAGALAEARVEAAAAHANHALIHPGGAQGQWISADSAARLVHAADRLRAGAAPETVIACTEGGHPICKPTAPGAEGTQTLALLSAHAQGRDLIFAISDGAGIDAVRGGWTL